MRKVSAYGPLYVLQYRLTNMRRFLLSIAFYSVADPLLYLLAIGMGVGSLINKNIGLHGIDGVDYLTFLAPALLATSAIRSAMDETMFPTLSGFLWDKLFFGMRATPLTGRDISLGVYFAALVRSFGSSFTYFIIMWAFGVLKSPHAYLALFSSALSGMAFGAVMLAIASRTKNEDTFFTFIGRFVIGPMFFLSGTFFQLNSMPIYVRWVGWISPLWHATDLGRYLTYGSPVPTQLLVVHVLYLTTMTLIGISLSARWFEERLTR